MKYDLIIVSASKSRELIRMTQQCIDSCLADGADVNVILVETHSKVNYRNVHEHIMYEGEFRYNRALNMGIRKAKGDVFILANNDLIFQPGWSKIGDVMQANNYLSASALSNDARMRAFKRGDYAYEGYDIGWQLAGWCLFVDRKCIEKIGPLDESHKFWYSDNAYATQLKKAKIKHALICNATVLHLGSATLKKEPREIIHLFTHAEGKKVSDNNRKNISS